MRDPRQDVRLQIGQHSIKRLPFLRRLVAQQRSQVAGRHAGADGEGGGVPPPLEPAFVIVDDEIDRGGRGGAEGGGGHASAHVARGEAGVGGGRHLAGPGQRGRRVLVLQRV